MPAILRNTKISCRFKPHKDLNKLELLNHRDRVTKERPSLSSRAGKTFVELQSGQIPSIVYGPIITKGKMRGSRIAIRVVARPEPDVEKLAKALLLIAKGRSRSDKTL